MYQAPGALWCVLTPRSCIAGDLDRGSIIMADQLSRWSNLTGRSTGKCAAQQDEVLAAAVAAVGAVLLALIPAPVCANVCSTTCASLPAAATSCTYVVAEVCVVHDNRRTCGADMQHSSSQASRNDRFHAVLAVWSRTQDDA